MTRTIPMPANFFQLAYVTNDLERAVERFGEVYGVREFMIRESCVTRRSPQGEEAAPMRVALAFVGELEIEIIEGRHDNPAHTMRIYSEALPATGFGLSLHHVAYHVQGDETDWRAFREGIDETLHPVVLEGDLDTIKWAYLDDRALVGHYNEFIWHKNSDIHSKIPQNLPSSARPAEPA